MINVFKQKYPARFWFFFIIVFMAALYLLVHIFPGIRSGSKANPVRPLEQHQYYQIIDQDNGKTLTFISVTVSVGDEYISGDSRRYVVVRLSGNKAYAKYAGIVNRSATNSHK